MKGETALEIFQLPVLEDNYIYIIHDPETGCCGCVDPALADPVIEFLEARGWSLDYIFNTHHHNDHVGGNRTLRAEYSCRVIGADHDAHRIPEITNKVQDGDEISLGAVTGHVMDVAGHTKGHIAYFFPDQKTLFCGDTIFAMGCGRLFEGTPSQMWSSLQKLRGLGDDVSIYCAHEYTAANAAFALSVDPDNATLHQRVQEVKSLRAAGKPTIPTLMDVEKQTNPFLRADVDRFKEAMGMSAATADDVFAETRRRKDNF